MTNPLVESYDNEYEYLAALEAHIKELEVENARITDAYKKLITKLNAEERAEINISP